jgi:hypothetical protein
MSLYISDNTFDLEVNITLERIHPDIEDLFLSKSQGIWLQLPMVANSLVILGRSWCLSSSLLTHQ